MPFDRLYRAVPEAFFQFLTEYTDAAFATAWLTATKTVAAPEVSATASQLRHALCEDAFRRAANEAGMDGNWYHTEPRGGRYSMSRNDDVVMVRCNVQKHMGTPRPTGFRKAHAAVNEWLDPPHPSLLEEIAPAPDDLMCAMVISTVEHRVDPTVPAYLGLGVPSPDMRRWLFRASIVDLLAMYRDRSAPTVGQPTVEVKDVAVPRLKPRKE
ncbi:hypothetical protein VW23_012600 [Devosia insulae DS-56]|uniref:Uncharacterized protein n=1 Tax=Devosia insulae DS-56 TaxID=1116389 RepID=A0A1E5XUG1_9HYPH|nr:hypothetical protein [Devosia insulae]OEO32229.1 hypothetical protein VW23_012600 [Devosia insulae DS-56]